MKQSQKATLQQTNDTYPLHDSLYKQFFTHRGTQFVLLIKIVIHQVYFSFRLFGRDLVFCCAPWLWLVLPPPKRDVIISESSGVSILGICICSISLRVSGSLSLGRIIMRASGRTVINTMGFMRKSVMRSCSRSRKQR